LKTESTLFILVVVLLAGIRYQARVPFCWQWHKVGQLLCSWCHWASLQTGKYNLKLKLCIYGSVYNGANISTLTFESVI